MSRLSEYLGTVMDDAVRAGHILDLAKQDKLNGSLLLMVHFREGIPVKLGAMLPIQPAALDTADAITSLKGIDKAEH